MALNFKPKPKRLTRKDRQLCELSTNGIMIKFFRSALGKISQSDSADATGHCPRIALGSFKRLMTELETSPKIWPDSRQPVPSELLVNILNALEFERKAEIDRLERL